MRDINRQIEQGREIIRKHEQADLHLTEIRYFMDSYDNARPKWDSLAYVIHNAFLMGVAVGSRNGQSSAGDRVRKDRARRNREKKN